jgi:hypothetical protein
MTLEQTKNKLKQELNKATELRDTTEHYAFYEGKRVGILRAMELVGMVKGTE